jgi:hypothetical protein
MGQLSVSFMANSLSFMGQLSLVHGPTLCRPVPNPTRPIRNKQITVL